MIYCTHSAQALVGFWTPTRPYSYPHAGHTPELLLGEVRLRIAGGRVHDLLPGWAGDTSTMYFKQSGRDNTVGFATINIADELTCAAIAVCRNADSQWFAPMFDLFRHLTDQETHNRLTDAVAVSGTGRMVIAIGRTPADALAGMRNEMLLRSAEEP